MYSDCFHIVVVCLYDYLKSQKSIFEKVLRTTDLEHTGQWACTHRKSPPGRGSREQTWEQRTGFSSL